MIDYLVAEAVVLKAQKEEQEREKKRERDEWRRQKPGQGRPLPRE